MGSKPVCSKCQGLKRFEYTQSNESKAGDNMLSQNHLNSALRKGKATTLNSVKIKIEGTRAETSLGEFSHWVINFYDWTTSSTCDVEFSTSICNRRLVADCFQKCDPFMVVATLSLFTHTPKGEKTKDTTCSKKNSNTWQSWERTYKKVTFLKTVCIPMLHHFFSLAELGYMVQSPFWSNEASIYVFRPWKAGSAFTFSRIWSNPRILGE